MKFSFPFIALLLILSPLAAQEENSNQDKTKKTEVKKEEVFRKDGKSAVQSEETFYEIGILMEYISVDHATANELIQEYGDQPNDVSELRDRLEVMLDKDEAVLIETAWVRSRSGSRAETKSVREYIYPSEFDPPEIPNYVGNSEGHAANDSKYGNVHLSSANPTAFECRDSGTSLEVDAIIGAKMEVISVNLAPEIVTRLEDRHYLREGLEQTARGIEHIFTPTFYAIKDTTQVDVAPGKYNLLGVHIPHDNHDRRILTLIRADLIPIH